MSATATKANDFEGLAGAYFMAWNLTVIPVSPLTKRPLIKRWTQIKENSCEQIQEWHRQFPNAAVGLCTGEQSRFFTLDVDKGAGGFGSLHQLEETHGKLPATMRVETPSGGRHINFRNPAGVRLFNRAGDILPGIDIRGNGGQVLAPGSMRANGKIYRQLDDDFDFDTLADPPKWLLFLGMFNKNQRERLAARGILCAADFGDLPPQRWAEKARELLKPASARSGPAGELSDARKAALVRYVNTTVEAELEKLVTEAAQGHRDNDLQKAATICVSLVYGLRDTGVDDHEFEEDVFDKLCSAGSMLSRGEEFGEENVRGKWERLVDAVDRGTVTPRDLFHVGLDARERASADEEFADIGVKSRLEFCRDISLAEIAKRRKLALVEGLTMPGDVGGLYGHPGTGKSFLGCDLSFHVALGKEWHGKRVTRAPVLYLPLEGRDGFRKRTKAAELKHGDPGDWFAIQRAHVLLAKGKAGEEGIAEVIASAKELEAKCGQPVGLVIIDTYARAIAGDDENTTCEAMAYLEKRAGEIQRRTGAAVLTLYHPNKQGGFRGASAQPAGLDFILRIDRNGSRRTLRVEKVKDGEDGVALFDFELATVELPGTEGEMSCTVDASPPSRQGRPPEPTSEKALREAFASLEATEGRQLDTGGEPAVELPLKSVRKAFARFHGGSKAAVQKAFRRLAEALPGDFEIEGKVIRRQCFPDD